MLCDTGPGILIQIFITLLEGVFAPCDKLNGKGIFCKETCLSYVLRGFFCLARTTVTHVLSWVRVGLVGFGAR